MDAAKQAAALAQGCGDLEAEATYTRETSGWMEICGGRWKVFLTNQKALVLGCEIAMFFFWVFVGTSKFGNLQIWLPFETKSSYIYIYFFFKYT